MTDTEVRARKHIFLVEDDCGIREAMQEILEGEGYAVTLAENGRELLDRLTARPPPDLLILDLLMPVMDGWAFLAARKENRILRRVPVIVVTADRRVDAQMVDAESLMIKPFDIVLFLETISRIFDKIEVTPR